MNHGSKRKRRRSCYRKLALHVSRLEPRLLLAAQLAGDDSYAALPPSRGSVDAIFISGDVAGAKQLASAVLGRPDVVILDPVRSGLDQISEFLALRTNVSSVHLIGHGTSGAMQLGGDLLNSDALESREDVFRAWSRSLADEADILLYGCDVAADASGESFLSEFARLTGADVAASDDATGAAQLGGDWELEWIVGSIETAIAFDPIKLRAFSSTLPIVIRAAGVMNDEQMLLQVNGATVATFNNIGGDAYAGVFQSYTHPLDGVAPGQVRIVFTNDYYDPANGIDRNLRIDKITVDGVDYQTESPTVYSTGTWLPADGVVAGYRQNEYLHVNGYFQFADPLPATGSQIRIRARGFEGTESMDLRINGGVVQAWDNVSTSLQTYTFTAASLVTGSQVRVGFTNDLWNPGAGIDRNLLVDWIEIDSTRLQTEHPSVYSTASWLPADGIVPGYRQSEILNSNGYFQYADPVTNNGSLIVVHANGAEGDENMTLQIDGANVASWSSIGTARQAFSYTAVGTVTPDRIRVVFTNDLWNPAAGVDRNLVVDRITIDSVDYQTEHPSVYSTGSWLPADGIVPGYRQSEVLNSNGYFQYASIAPANPGTVGFSKSQAIINESAGTVTLTLNRIDGSDGAVSVQYATVNGTAIAGEDYVAQSGIVTFQDGETTKTIVITITEDAIDEPSEAFNVTLTNPTGGAALGIIQATVTIVDNDQSVINNSLLFAYGGRLYYRTDTPLTWDAAQAQAVSVGGHLVTINDAAEEAWLKQSFPAQSYWIGLREQTNANDFAWVSGEALTYVNWDAGQPDDPNASSKGALDTSLATPVWDDRLGSTLLHGIIEIGSSLSNGIPPSANGAGFSKQTIASGLNQPISFAVAPDGRIFVTEKQGRVRIIQNGTVLPTPFYDINLLVNSHHDRGMMGIALDPDFATNGYVYLQYTTELNPANPDAPNFNSTAGGELIRVTASTSDPNVADPTSRVLIQDGHQMTHATHSVGDIDFDNDGNLIFTWGDGGFDNALRLSAQDPSSRQGKLFRINRTTFQGVPTNPWYDVANPSSIASRVWAVGIRNSWKLNVDRATGDVYMGEVTDNGPEEINIMRANGTTYPNYGWPYYQGDNRTSYGTLPPGFVYQSPFVALAHSNIGSGDSILGGPMYRGTVYPAVYQGRYFFGNFNQGQLYSADEPGNIQLFGNPGDHAGVVDLQVGPDGYLWTMSLLSGKIERLIYTPPTTNNVPPIINAGVSLTAAPSPLFSTLNASASIDTDGDPLTFFWDFDSNGTVDATGPIASHQFEAIGRTTTTLYVSDGRGGVSTQLLEFDRLAVDPADGNLALGRPAIQSITQGLAIASRAVDGNTNSTPAGNSITETARVRTPLWEVDLGAVYDLSSIQIHRRSDGVNTLRNYWILIAPQPFTSTNLDAAQNDPGVWTYHQPGTAAAVETVNIGALGRYVRIQLEGVNDILSLAEVKVFGA